MAHLPLLVLLAVTFGFPSLEAASLTANSEPTMDRESGCCSSLSVTGKHFDGMYEQTSEQHNGRPIYQQEKWCIYYGNFWMIGKCDNLNNSDDGYTWYVKSNVDAMCPGSIGPQWKYYTTSP